MRATLASFCITALAHIFCHPKWRVLVIDGLVVMRKTKMAVLWILRSDLSDLMAVRSILYTRQTSPHGLFAECRYYLKLTTFFCAVGNTEPQTARSVFFRSINSFSGTKFNQFLLQRELDKIVLTDKVKASPWHLTLKWHTLALIRLTGTEDGMLHN